MEGTLIFTGLGTAIAILALLARCHLLTVSRARGRTGLTGRLANRKSTHPSDEILQRYWRNEFASADRLRVAGHLVRCEQCRELAKFNETLGKRMHTNLSHASAGHPT